MRFDLSDEQWALPARTALLPKSRNLHELLARVVLALPKAVAPKPCTYNVVRRARDAAFWRNATSFFCASLLDLSPLSRCWPRSCCHSRGQRGVVEP